MLRKYLALLFFLPLAACESSTTAVNPAHIKIGALLQLSAGFTDLSKIDKAALEIALEDANAEVSAQNSTYSFELDIRDTKDDSATALSELKSLHSAGVQIVLGLETSAEAAAVLPFANQEGTVLVTNSSTAVSLAIPNDNLLRLIPDDREQAKALVALMALDGVERLAIIFRNDNYGADLTKAIKANAPLKGITMEVGYLYDPADTGLTSLAEQLKTIGHSMINQFGEKPSAICLIGFDEVGDVFKLLSGESWIKKLKWYGSDGTALSSRFAKPDVAAFADSAYFPCPLYGIDPSLTDTLAARIKQRAGAEPYSNSFLIYDALRLAAKAYIASGGDESSLRNEFIAQANSYTGVSGKTTLNAAGDRAFGDYDFWAVRNSAVAPEWRKVAHYSASGAVVKY